MTKAGLLSANQVTVNKSYATVEDSDTRMSGTDKALQMTRHLEPIMLHLQKRRAQQR